MSLLSETDATALTGGASDRPNGPVAHGDLELAKWIALIAMVIDHYGKIVEPSLYLETHAIGRVSFPLFAAIVGTRLALHPSLGAR